MILMLTYQLNQTNYNKDDNKEQQQQGKLT